MWTIGEKDQAKRLSIVEALQNSTIARLAGLIESV
jgi:hypothetical protein